jgi:pimeloyl-ACP methyl ester carboxylesterase
MPAAESGTFTPFASAQARQRYLAHYDAREKSWPIRFETAMVPTDFGTTFVRMSGSPHAPPLILLPGANSTSLSWRTLIEPISARFRTYALDAVYDAGRSIPSRPMKDIDDLIAWLGDVLDTLGLSAKIDLVGMSYGAYAITEYALHEPGRVRKIVWLSPAMIVAPVSQEFVDRLKPCVAPEREPLAAFSRWIMPGLAASDERAFNERVDDLILIRECYGTRMLPLRKQPVLSDDELRSIPMPVLYIVGENDGVCDDPRAAVARVNEVAPRIETFMVPGAGHDAALVQPVVISQRMLRFLESEPRVSPARR